MGVFKVMGEIYTTQETRREIDRAGLGPAFGTYQGATVLVTHPDALDPKTGKLSERQVRQTLQDYGENVQSVTAKAPGIHRDLQNESFYQMKAYSSPNLKTQDGQDVCLITGNLTYQSKTETFSSLAYMDAKDLQTDRIPGESRDWATLTALHETGHCANKDNEKNTPDAEAESGADRYAITEYNRLAADPANNLNPDVPRAWMDARILGSAFVGFDPKGKNDTMFTATTLLQGKPEEHDTYLSVTKGLSAEDSAAAASRANTLIYSMAPQAEKIRRGGADAFAREHPEMAEGIASTPSEAFDQAGHLMDIQKNPDVLKNPESQAEAKDAITNAAYGAMLVNEDPALAYATSQAVLDNGMVPKGSPEETYIKDYMGAMETYRPKDADADLGAEVSANFDNTVPEDKIDRSNATRYDNPTPESTPIQTPAPEAGSKPPAPPSPEEEEPTAPAPSYNASYSKPSAPSFG